MTRFLGRRLNINTMMWEHNDGSGTAYPEEMRLEVMAACDIQPLNGADALGTLFKWKHRLNPQDKRES